MVKLFYSYHDESLYILHDNCPLGLIMGEHTGGDGLLVFASKDALEIVEYIDGVESGFTTMMMTKVKELASEMDCCATEFFAFVDRMMEDKC